MPAVPVPAVSEGVVDGAVELGVVAGIVDAADVAGLEDPVLAVPVVPGLAEVRESLQATVPAIVKQAMAIRAAVRSVRILCSSWKLPGRWPRRNRVSNRRAGLVRLQRR